MEAHPDNEPDSEFADRIEDLKDLPKMIEDYTKEKTKNLELQIDVILSGSSHELSQEYADKWISVKDRLPEYNARVLVAGFPTHPTMDGKPTISVKHRRKINDFLRVATHWMELPEPPKED